MEDGARRVRDTKTPRRVCAKVSHHGAAHVEHVEYVGQRIASVHGRESREHPEQFRVVSRTDKTLRRSNIRRLSRTG
jgi:hypothetical protein